MLTINIFDLNKLTLTTYQDFNLPSKVEMSTSNVGMQYKTYQTTHNHQTF
jgi:hypothetical protein